VPHVAQASTATQRPGSGLAVVVRRLIVLLLAFAVPAAVAPSAGAATKLTIRGAGFGHGIGLSQYGAYGYALHLAKYDAILAHYYTGTALGQLGSAPPVRVLLQTSGVQRFRGVVSAGGRTLSARGTYSVARRGAGVVLRSASGRALLTGPQLRVDAPAGGVLRLFGVTTSAVRDGLYRGGLILAPSGSGVAAVNVLDLESYVRGVVGGEVPASWPTEALKAQAVAARTYAITTHSGGALFDQYAGVSSQVYRGLAAESAATDAAVAATRGVVVTYAGKPVTTFFFSTSGGKTEDIQNSFVGSSPKPWLKGVVDPFDSVSPKHRWGPLRLSDAQVRGRIGRWVKGSFRGIQVLQRGFSPRVVRAVVLGSRGRTTVTGPQLRSAFGLYDTWASFTAVGTAVRAPAPVTARAAGAGAGAVAARLTGTITPARPGMWLKVQRRSAGRWHTAAEALVGAGGRYEVSVGRAGLYRVAFRGALGPATVVP
jgi:stage II sporulation protein D